MIATGDRVNGGDRGVGSDRAEGSDAPWPLRPWIMATICALAGLAFYWLVDGVDRDASDWRVVGSSFVAVAAISFVLTVEPGRWWWSLAFAVAWGAVVGLVGWTTYNYNGQGELVEFPFMASIFAVLLACPLFQTARDAGAWRFTSGRVHNHAWTDAVIGAASLAFVGITFLLAWLIASLFELIGIEALENLLEEKWFIWTLAGFAFGAAVGLLRERDALVGTMQRLVIIVLAVLAPVLAIALIAFLLSLPVTGLAGLWEGWVSAAGLMLAAAGGSYLLLNAAIGLGDEDRPTNRVLGWAALALALVVLPLAALATAAVGLRIDQYGLTPGRMWAVICCAVAIAYGIAGWWAVWRGRLGFAPMVRNAQTRLALGVCALAVILALPIVDFGAVSTRDQLSRLTSGATPRERFDWQAMAFDFGPSGRAALQRLSRAGTTEQRGLAAEALAATNRYDIPTASSEPSDLRPLAQRLRFVPAERAAPVELMAAVEKARTCGRGACVILWIEDDRIAVLNQIRPREWVNRTMYHRNAQGIWTIGDRPMAVAAPQNPDDLTTARVEAGERRQRVIRIDGREVYSVDESPLY